MSSVHRWALAVACVAGCGGGGGSGPATTACKPLDAHEDSISLTGLIAAGRHADGTVYAVDEPSSGAYRVFSSEGSQLIRRRVAGGSFERTSDGTAFTLTVTESAPFTLKIEVPASGAKRMGVVRGAFNDKTFTIGQTGDVLIVDDAAVQGLQLRNLSGGQHVEYAVDVADGRHLVVIRPTDDWTYQDFRLFLGSADRMEEREVRQVTRLSDGGTTAITCVLEGQDAKLYFPSPWKTAESAYLETGGARQALITTTSWTAESLQYVCF